MDNTKLHSNNHRQNHNSHIRWNHHHLSKFCKWHHILYILLRFHLHSILNHVGILQYRFLRISSNLQDKLCKHLSWNKFHMERYKLYMFCLNHQHSIQLGMGLHKCHHVSSIHLDKSYIPKSWIHNR